MRKLIKSFLPILCFFYLTGELSRDSFKKTLNIQGDLDGDLKISRLEYYLFSKKSIRSILEEEKISFGEIAHLFDKDVDKYFLETDSDGDGYLTQEEIKSSFYSNSR